MLHEDERHIPDHIVDLKKRHSRIAVSEQEAKVEGRTVISPVEQRYLKALKQSEATLSKVRKEQEALRQKVREAKAEARRLEKDVRWHKARRSEEQLQRGELKQTVKALKAQTEGQSQKILELKSDLKRVRGSRAYRLGRNILAPARITRAFIRRLGAEIAENAYEPSGLQATYGTDSYNGCSGTLGQYGPVTMRGKIVESSEDRSYRRSTQQPCVKSAASSAILKNESAPAQLAGSSVWGSVDNFKKELYTSWYSLGQVEVTERTIQENRDLVAQLDNEARRNVEKMLGEIRLKNIEKIIPNRVPGAAYRPQQGRVMYCVHSTPLFNSNGYSTRTRGIAKGLVDAGKNVVVVSRVGYPWDTACDTEHPRNTRCMREFDGVTYIHNPGSSISDTPMDRYVIEAADTFVREALVSRPEIIHSASNHRTALAALIAARRIGIPFVYEVRGFWEHSQASRRPSWAGSEHFHLQHEMEILVAKHADHVYAITSQVKDVLVAGGIEAGKISIAPNAVDSVEFAPIPRDREYAKKRKIREDVPIIGFAGSMVGYEGLDLLLRASAELLRRSIDHQLVFAGSGTDEDKLRALAGELSLSSKHVRFLGRLPIEEMPRLLSCFDICPITRNDTVVTNLVSPLKPLESFSAMRSVILSDVKPHVDLAGSNRSRALLYKAGSLQSLVSSIEHLIENADRRRDLVREARQWVVMNRTWRAVGAVLVEGYSKAARYWSKAVEDREVVGSRRPKVGIIADEFTTKTLAPDWDLKVISRSNWRDDLGRDKLDLLFIESAWNGNGGDWHRGVGDYGQEEHSDIEHLIDAARDMGIPSVFWNKEDPVHLNRFKKTASMCDHVLTTDASLISEYLSVPGNKNRTVSALPFFAQPALHNPLPPKRAYEHTVAYAGTYYGDRYKARSNVLRSLLETAQPFGLTIYDRQAGNADSPYRFPPEFVYASKGSMSYEDTIESYKSHIAHINVNSVTASPTMYSRRIVEIAASGGLVLSGPGRGVHETFNGVIPAYTHSGLWGVLLEAWANDPEERVREAWRQMRAVYRSRTTDTALTIVLRTAGLEIAGPVYEEFSLAGPKLTSDFARTLIRQSVRPKAVYVDDVPAEVIQELESGGIAVYPLDRMKSVGEGWFGLLEDLPSERTWFEDMLLATRFGSWDRISVRKVSADDLGCSLASTVASNLSLSGLVKVQLGTDYEKLVLALGSSSGKVVQWTVPKSEPTESVPTEPVSVQLATNPVSAPRTVLVAGHDLKFAKPVVSALEQAGHRVLVDMWRSHTAHDEDRSKDLLAQSDVIWCEWGLGNLEWYSRNVRTQQRLVTRIHLQELDRPYLRRSNTEAVDSYIFIGELIRRSAVESHGVPIERSIVVPNVVDTEGLMLSKSLTAPFTVGFVGMVPQRKRVDLALDVISKLNAIDGRYSLRIKGKTPYDYPWMQNRPDEMRYYSQVFERIDDMNQSRPGIVQFDGYGDDMASWYRNVGIALSVSDYESFHYTIADGAASGAIPASLLWPGSDLFYPLSWLSSSVDALVDSILSRTSSPRDEHVFIQKVNSYEVVLPELVSVILGQ